jgi:hypothetical protein
MTMLFWNERKKAQAFSLSLETHRFQQLKGSFCLFFFKYHIIPQKYYHLDRASISIYLKVRNLGFYGELLRNFTVLSTMCEQ